MKGKKPDYNIVMTALGNSLTIPQKSNTGTSLAVQRLRLHASAAGGVGSIPEDPACHVMRPKKFKNKKKSNTKLPDFPAIPLLGIYPQQLKT